MRYVAFLRGINVGGHKASMGDLRAGFEGLGFHDVSTFINSGNVLFEGSGKPGDLEPRIEAKLRAVLGYEVPTFLRTASQVQKLAAHAPFPQLPEKAVDEGTLQVGFLHGTLPAAAKRQVADLAGERDHLTVTGREVWWFTKTRMMESDISAAQIDKAAGVPLTLRNINTVRRLAAKL